MLAFVLSLLGLAVTVGVPWLLVRWLGSRQPSLTPLPIARSKDGGSDVPLVATFLGVRGLAWFAFANNSLNPRLTLTPQGIDYKVVGRLRSRTWASIRCVDVQRFGSTVNLTFAFHDSAVTFTANTGSEILAGQVLALLPAEVPLTDRARKRVDKDVPLTESDRRANVRRTDLRPDRDPR